MPAEILDPEFSDLFGGQGVEEWPVVSTPMPFGRPLRRPHIPSKSKLKPACRTKDVDVNDGSHLFKLLDDGDLVLDRAAPDAVSQHGLNTVLEPNFLR